MSTFKDFVGLNSGIYDPTANDAGTMNSDGIEGNYIGYDLHGTIGYIEGNESNSNITSLTRHNPRSTMILLNLHRNGPYGYPTWKQIRAGENHLTRYQRKSNIFTYVEEHDGRFGNTRSFIEPVVVDSYKPVSLVGEMKVYNNKTNEFQNRSVELKTSFGNETAFFANSKINDYFETIAETDENYEQLKDLYLDGGLEDEGSPIDSFNMFVYRQSIYPKQQYAYLDETRIRKYYVNTFWRADRLDRTQTNVDTGFAGIVPSQSMWPLDVASDWTTRQEPSENQIYNNQISTYNNLYNTSYDYRVYEYYIGGEEGSNFELISNTGPTLIYRIGAHNTGEDTILSPPPSEGGSGILVNSYSQFSRGYYSYLSGYVRPVYDTLSSNALKNALTASCFYSRRHAINGINSVVSPTGMTINEMAGMTHIPTGSLFQGIPAWDAAKIASNEQGVDKSPFRDSYGEFAEELRLKGKGFGKVPEFRISNHVERYLTKGITEELEEIFELSGALSQDSTTENQDHFYQILSTTDFLKHFDLVKSDHKDLSREKILTLKCKGLKKFIPYDGFYPAQRTVDLSQEFYDSIKKNVEISGNAGVTGIPELGLQGILEPLFAPGILFNTIKSGVAVDYPIVLPEDDPSRINVDQDGKAGASSVYDEINVFNIGSNLQGWLIGADPRTLNSFFSRRIPFEALLEPELYLQDVFMSVQETHPFGLSDNEVKLKWNGGDISLYKKKMNNFLAETANFFMMDGNFKTLSSLENSDPNFGNAVSGNYYLARVKMTRTTDSINGTLNDAYPPQTINGNENLTMYSRPTAFGPPAWGTDAYGTSTNGVPLGPSHGYNFLFTPPYYHGESWCDLIFYATRTKKYSLDEILNEVSQFPYMTRFWEPGYGEILRDLTGYSGSNDGDAEPYISSGKFSSYANSKWKDLLELGFVDLDVSVVEQGGTDNNDPNLDDMTALDSNQWRDPWANTNYTTDAYSSETKVIIAPQSPPLVNYNAMQLDSSINLFAKGTIKKIKLDNVDERVVEVASSETKSSKSRWIIQTKFETPILDFGSYVNLRKPYVGSSPLYSAESAARGMWHQYGFLPRKDQSVSLQITDIPESWLTNALNIPVDTARSKIKSLADLVGFSKDPVRLGEVADVKQISEAVVAVPFIEKDGTRQFFSIPREDIDSCINSSLLESSPGNFTAGQTPKAGDSVYQMVKKMQKYVFPPSMDFVKYKEIDPFAMYVFEFKHNLTKQDLADIWQNLPPEIGTRMEEAEATISHELLAHELLGGGSVVKNGVLDDNAEGNGIPSNIQWMIFKAKKRAKTNYFDKVVAKKGTTKDTSSEQLENAQGQTGDDLGITYNWPYDFFSLVELVKIDAEVTFANIENDDKGQKTIKKVEKKNPLEVSKTRAAARGINIARGKGKPKK